MTQEEKFLLLQDLCARLPYGVFVHTWYNKPLDIGCTGVDIYTNTIRLDLPDDYYARVYIDNVKPYLRPTSSMTDEEKEEFESLGWRVDELDDNAPWNHNSYNVFDGVDWLNKKMFAYRTIDGKDMFELGLALKAPEGMYNKEK